MERIQKLLANYGVASRRTIEEFIKAGRIKVNGKTAMLGDKASNTDNILLDGKPISKDIDKVYFVLNKPAQTITSAKDPQGRDTVFNYINEKARLFTVGRLDYNTTGALILTNDGDLAHKLMHPSYEIIRVYKAKINRVLTKQELSILNGDKVLINDKPSSQEVVHLEKKSYSVILHQGSYHHVKKLFEYVGASVLKLKRVEYAGVNIIGLKEGNYRPLKIHEVKMLKLMTKK